MSTVGDRVVKIRSKNAGPYWLTVDIFCGSPSAYQEMLVELTTDRVAGIYRVPEESLKRFELPALDVIKFSFPRSTVQGGRCDRDMHGAQMSVLLAELEI